jgi:glycogen synthase
MISRTAMRILFITAFYPPHVVGGWEQLVRDVNLRLQERGHETHVLTSQHRVDGPLAEPGVSRLLTLESDLYHYRPLDYLGHRRRLAQNMARTTSVIRDFRPDVVFVHVMFNLSHAIPWQAEQLLPGKVAYYVADNWPCDLDPHTTYWTANAQSPLLNIFKQLLAPLPLALATRERKAYQLEFERVLCVSHAVKENLARNAGINDEALYVVHNGVETDRFVPADRANKGPGLALVYAGSLVPHKGVDIAIMALRQLKQQGQLEGITLDIIGGGHPHYEAHLRDLVNKNDLHNVVNFQGRVAREQMPALLQKFDALLFPSIWEEPLSRMMQEAMAAGLVVIGTLTGGSGELLVENETGLTFPPGDAVALAAQIIRLNGNRHLRQQLARQGRATVLSRFDLTRMIDQIEVHLNHMKQQLSQQVIFR